MTSPSDMTSDRELRPDVDSLSHPEVAPSGEDRFLGDLEEQYTDALLNGQTPAIEEVVARCPPHLANNLRRRLRLVSALTRSAPEILFSENSSRSGPATAAGSERSINDVTTQCPRRIGRFDIIRVAGRGAFGVVFEARDSELNRRVAIKMPHGSLSWTKENKDRFLREARSAANLRHPHIVPVYEIAEVDGHPYLVTEYVDGETLADTAARRRMPYAAVATLAKSIAEALHSAHLQGIVHRDVKPGNILIDQEGQPHITDFGLARITAEQSLLTTEGQLLGTPAYMSPEQAAGHVDQVDARSDLYSLGVVLYELLTGEAPFRGVPHLVIQQVLAEEPRPPRKWDDRIPRDLETVCLRAMAKAPSRRFQSAQELADDLQRYLSHEPIHSRRVSRAERLAQWCRRKPIVASLMALVVMLLLTICVLSGLGYLRENSIRAQAERRRERAEELLGSLVTQADQFGETRAHTEQVERNLYQLSLDAADQSLRMENTAEARRILSRYGNQADSKDWRGWEWAHLYAKSEGQKVTAEVDVGQPVDAVAEHPDAVQIALGAGDRIVLWNCRESAPVTTWDVPRMAASPIACNDAATQLAVVRRDGAVTFWNPATAAFVSEIPLENEHVLAMAWDRTGSLQIASVANGGLWTWDAAKSTDRRRVYAIPRDSNPLLAAAWSHDCQRLAVAGAMGEITILKCDPDGRWVKEASLKAEGHVPSALAWCPYGHRLASAGSDHTVRILDTEGRATLISLRDIAEPIRGLSWNRSGHRVTGVSTTSRVFHWSIPQEHEAAFLWSEVWYQAVLAAIRGDWIAVREHCQSIRKWAGRQGQNASDTNERLFALASCAELLQRCDLLAEAITTNRQILSFDVSRLPTSQTGDRPTNVIAARRTDECVARLFSDAALPPSAQLENLEHLLSDLFPYGRAEIPIPFQVPPSDAVAPLWQQPQIVIEVARRAGALDRLRNEWEKHAHADSDSLLALRIEASAAANDTVRQEQLLQGITSGSSLERLPLWSENCRLQSLRRRIRVREDGFNGFSLSSESVRPYVSQRADKVRIVAPDVHGDRTRLGVVRRQPITGDFELAVDFEFKSLESSSRVTGLYLQLDLLEGGEVLNFSRSLSADIGHEFVAYQSQVTPSNDFKTRMWRFPTNVTEGRFIMARSGSMLYWLLAEGVNSPARVIHMQPCPSTDVAAVWLFVEGCKATTNSQVDAVLRHFSLRTE